MVKTAFSTLGCPEWTWENILAAARELGYDGISLRGLGAVLDDMSQAEPFRAERIKATKAELSRQGLEICSLDTSVSFDKPEKFTETLAAGRACLDLAGALGIGRIRVFGNSLLAGEQMEQGAARVASGLRSLAAHAEDRGVDILLETHGDFLRGRDLRSIMEQADHPKVGVLWDLHHPYRLAGERIEETYRELKPYIKAVHLKDSRGNREAFNYCLFGRGDVPWRDGLRLLKTDGYSGWLILEWEKRWHLELEPPEAVFPHFIMELRRAWEEI